MEWIEEVIVRIGVLGFTFNYSNVLGVVFLHVLGIVLYQIHVFFMYRFQFSLEV